MKTKITLRMKSASIGALAALAIASCSPAEETAQPVPSPTDIASPSPVVTATGADYSTHDNWLCRPDKANDACAVDTSVTTVRANSVSKSTIETATAPLYDCFYIYPTISLDQTPNSDLTPGAYEELLVVGQQLAPFKDTCRLFAPIYRQLTLTELNRFMSTGELTGDVLTRYLDVKNAWKHYLEHDNEGRGVVLIGHSQGAAMVQELLAKHINNTAEVDLIISAVAAGYNTPVAPDGTGFNMGLPICENADQAGCLMSWNSFRADVPPAEATFLGKALPIGMRQSCTNPAALLGKEDGALDPIMPSQPLGSAAPVPYYDDAPVETAFVELPGMLSASCQSNATHDWLSVSVAADPADKRIDDIPGDVMKDGARDPDWGLHMVDSYLVAGDLKKIFDRQHAVWTSRFIEE